MTSKIVVDNKYTLLAGVFCVIFGLALIANVQQAGDGGWYWYATLLLEGKHLYRDLKLPLQPLMVLDTELFLVLLGNSWIAQKVPAVLHLLLYVIAMFLIVMRSRWSDVEKGIVLAAAFFVAILFEDYRFDDYHVLAGLLILYSVVLLLALKPGLTALKHYLIVSGIGVLAGLLLTTRVAEGAIILIVAAITTAVLSEGRRIASVAALVAAFAVTIVAIVSMTGDSLGLWASTTIFGAAGIKGGSHSFLTDPPRMVLSAIAYLGSGAWTQALSAIVVAAFAALLWEALSKPSDDDVLESSPGVGVAFLANTGLLIAVVVLITWAQGLHLLPFFGSSFLPQWLVVGIVGLLYGVAAFQGVMTRPSMHRWWDRSRIAFASVSVAATLLLVFERNTPYVFALAGAQFLVLYGLVRHKTREAGWFLVAALVSLVSWAFSLAVAYTPFDMNLLAATPTTSLSLAAFAVCFGFTWLALFGPQQKRQSNTIAKQILSYAVAAALFLWMALRVDGFVADWVPYHRSYWAGPATFIRHGHWLLWDIPSQYGFLSEIVVAVAPGTTTYQSLYLVTAIALVAQSLMLFAILRSYGRGMTNLIFSIAVAGAAFLSSEAGRYPFGGRPYPQIGLRFIWVETVLFLAFLLYRYPERARVLRAAGFVCWALGVAWSFESAVWTTVVWGGFLLADACLREGLRLKALLLRFAPFVVIPAMLILSVDLYYAHFLGHGPDWRSYVEFALIYSGNPELQQRVNPLGSGWLLILVLGATATFFAVAMAREKRKAAPVIVAAWLALWAVSTYYEGEAFSNHINALYGVIGFAFAIVAVVYRYEDLRRSTSARWALASFAPLVIILLTTAFSHIDVALLSPPYIRDAADYSKPIDGELLSLIEQAGITPADKVILPQSITWTTLDAGVVMPFLRDGNGNHQLVAWLPVSPNGPYGMWLTLSPSRRQTYVDRFVGMERGGGWLLTYEQPADCNMFSQRKYFVAKRKVSTPHYSAALCERL